MNKQNLDPWHAATGHAIPPTKCDEENLKGYHPMDFCEQYTVSLSRHEDKDGNHINNQYLLTLTDGVGWSGAAMAHVNFKPSEPDKSLIFKEVGPANGKYLYATPPRGTTMEFEGFELISWKIEIINKEPTTVFLDTLTWENTNESKTDGNIETSWRWINNP